MNSIQSLAGDSARSARRPQTLVSSLGFSNLTNKTIRSLQDLLRAIQPLQLDLYESKNLPEECWLGHGASYNVWKCLNRSSLSKEAVAVKKVKLPKGTDDFEAFQSRVACVLKDIVVMNHPPLAECEHILDLFGYGWNMAEGSIPFLVTEFAPGRTLRQFLQDNPDTSGMERVRFCRNVVDGLSELHQVGVIHGDLKLDNVLVVGMKARISDFGHSLLMTPADEEDTRQVYRGTELYNPPEITQQEYIDWETIDLRKCDMWALGLLCWEAMRGGIPFYEDRFVSSILSDSDRNRSQASLGSFLENTSISSQTSVLNNIARVQSQLKLEAKRYSNKSLKLLVPAFTRDMLRQLFEATLESDPAHRTNNASSLPLCYGTFSECPVAKPRLTDTTQKGSLWAFDQFVPSTSASIPFNAKKQMLSDWQRLAISNNNPTRAAALFQVGLAYATGFGTKFDISAFEDCVKRASERGHPVAQLIDNLLNRHKMRKTFDPRLSNFTFFIRQLVQMSKGREGREGAPAECDDRVSKSASDSHLDVPHSSGTLVNTGSNEYMLLQACKNGEYGNACNILSRNNLVFPFTPRSTSPLHWLFMFPEDEARMLMRKMDNFHRSHLSWKSDPVKLDDSLPFTLSGTPLAFAVAAGSLPTVEILLEKGAVPDQEIFALAARLHLHFIFDALVSHLKHRQESHSLLQIPDIKPSYLELCKASNFERLLIHGALQQVAIDSIVDAIKRLLDFRDLGTTRLRRHSSPSAFETTFKPPKVTVNNSSKRFSRLPSEVSPSESVIPLSSGIYYEAIEKAFNIADFAVAKALVSLIERIELDEKVSKHSEPLLSKTSLMMAATRAASTNSLGENIGRELINFGMAHGGSLNASAIEFLYRRPINLVIDVHREDLLIYLLDLGAEVNFSDESGTTPLLQLFKTGFANISRIKLLLSKGADVNIRDTLGHAALHIATEQGLVEEITVLLHDSANVNIHDNNQETALHYAIKFGQLKVLTILLQQSRLEVNAQDCEGNTSLMIATARGHNEMVKQLLDYGADKTITNRSGQSCLHIAAVHSQLACLKTILNRKDQDFLDILDDDGHTALSLVMRMLATTQDTQSLRDIWQNLLVAGSGGDVAFHWAIVGHDVSIVILFLEFAPDLFFIPSPKHERIRGKTALGLAAFNGDYDITKLILNHLVATHGSSQKNWYVHKKHQDLWGRSCLHNAVLRLLSMQHETEAERAQQLKKNELPTEEYLKIIYLLLISGVSPHATDNFGRTALHYAAIGANYAPSTFDSPWDPTATPAIRMMQLNLVQILLDAKSEPSLKDHQGYSSLHYASIGLNSEGFKRIYNLQKKTLTLSRDASLLFLTLKSLLAHSFDTPSFEMCFDLIDLGIDPFKPIENDETAYDLANRFPDENRKIFLRAYMLLRSLPTQEAENESQALPRKAARGFLADYPQALRVCQLKNLRDFALLPTSREASGTLGVEIRPYSSVLQVWINNMHLNPDVKEFSDQFTYAAWFGDLLLQAGADILSKSAGSKYLIEEATPRMNFNDSKYAPIVTWLIREHTREVKLDLTASKTHRMALDLGWKCALWNRTSLAMELYFDSGIMFDVTLLSLESMEHQEPEIATQYAKTLGDVPGVNLFRDVTAHEGTRSSPLSLLTLSVMRNSQNTTNLDELRIVWEACIVFDCRIKEIFVHPQNIQFIEKMVAHTRAQMHLQSRLEIFMATLPEGGAVGSPLKCRCMAGLISELDGIFGSQLKNSTTTSTLVVNEIDRLLGEFRKELATPPRDFDAVLERESLVQKFSRGALRFVDEEGFSSSVDVSFRWSTAAGYLNIAKVLLQGGASLKALDIKGRSVLHEAVECGSSKAIGFLLHMGLNPGHQNLAGQTSLHLAVERGDVFALNMLCKNISATDYSSFDKYSISAIILPKHDSGSLSKLGLFSSFTSFQNRSHNDFLRVLAGKKDCIGRTAFGLALQAGNKGRPVLDFILHDMPVLGQDGF